MGAFICSSRWDAAFWGCRLLGMSPFGDVAFWGCRLLRQAIVAAPTPSTHMEPGVGLTCWPHGRGANTRTQGGSDGLSRLQRPEGLAQAQADREGPHAVQGILGARRGDE